jgi:hypothetical protein
MKLSHHVAVGIGSGILLGVILRSWIAGISCCLVGIFIDLDHLLDFWIERGFSLSPRKFFDFCFHGTSRKFYDILHGYEFIPFLAWLTTVPSLRQLGWGLTVGYTLHLLGDQIFNTHLHRFTYFFSFRLYHRFDWKKIVQTDGRLPNYD